MSKDSKQSSRTIAQNRKARHDYLIEETLEAGLALTGSEVKSLRAGRVSITESYASEKDGELWLINAHIAEYQAAGRFGHAGAPACPAAIPASEKESPRPKK